MEDQTSTKPVACHCLCCWLAVGGWLAAFVISLFLDIPVSRWARDVGLAAWLGNAPPWTQVLRHPGLWRENLPRWAHVTRFPGNFAFTLVVCAILLVLGWRGKTPRHWRNAALIFLAGVLSGANVFLKWIIGRTRPFHHVAPFILHPFKGGIQGQWLAERNLAFPSGDASLAFAMSASLSMVVPRLWPLWWALGLLVAAERIAANAHYPSDTVAGAAVGIAAALLARWMVGKWWPEKPATGEIP